MRNSAEFTTRDALTIPVILTAAMLLIAVVTGQLGGVDWTGLPGPYIVASIGATGLALLISIFVWVGRMAVERADDPLRLVAAKCKASLPALVLPAIVMPVFLSGFTASKTAIPFLVGYTWDGAFADLDAILFGNDAWRITHAWLGTSWVGVSEWAYTFGWGAVFLVGSALISIHSPPRRAAIFFTAMFLTWLIGGFAMAYAFSAAGPAFAYLVEPSAGERFEGLQGVLSATLAPDGLLRTTQDYLANSLTDHVAHKGGGVSAMPSMHLGAASIFVLATWRTRYFLPAVAFWLVIFLLSAYFGYHYWVDAIPAAAIAGLSWKAADFGYNLVAPASSAPQLSPA